MLLTITTTHVPATDLGYLLYKNPAKCQEFEVSFGKVHVFYPEASAERCTAAMLLDVDPVGMVRGKAGSRGGGLLAQYVNDRPYVASSFLSVAIAQVFGSALQGRCKERPELAETPIPLVARLSALPCRGGEALLRRLFEPLGYRVAVVPHALDEKFPEWGQSPYFTVTLEKTETLARLLSHLYVLVPVLDGAKHYYVGDEEVEKLLEKGAGWLAAHPEREAIARRYLKFQPSLARLALARLAEEDQPEAAGAAEAELPEEAAEEFVSLNEQRLGAVLAALRVSGARRVLDLGCGEGRLVRELLRDRQFEEIVAVDVSVRSLEIAAARLKLERLPVHQNGRVRLMHGSLVYRDKRLAGFDAAAVAEVVEHLDPPRLAAFERAVFEFARPATVVLTTPNREYNVMWENLAAGPSADLRGGSPDLPRVTPRDIVPPLRHKDHRFEWTRAEFQSWASGVAQRFGYAVRFLPVGQEDAKLGPPTQMGVFATIRKATNG